MRCPKCNRENKDDAGACFLCYAMLINPKDKKKPLPPPIPIILTSSDRRAESTVEEEKEPVSSSPDKEYAKGDISPQGGEVSKEAVLSESSKSSIVDEKSPETSVVKEEQPMSSVIREEEPIILTSSAERDLAKGGSDKRDKPALSGELPKSPIVDKEKSDFSIVKEEKDISPFVKEEEEIAKSPLLAKILKSLFADEKKSKSSDVEEEKAERVNPMLPIELSDLPVLDKEEQRSPITEEEKPASPVVKEDEPTKLMSPIESSEPVVVLNEEEKPVFLGINEGEQSSPTVPIELTDPSVVNEEISAPLVEDEEEPDKGEKGFIGTWWSVISSPVTFFDKMPTSGGFGKPYLFALTNMLIAGLISFFVTLAGGGQIRKFVLERFQITEIIGPFLWVLLGVILLFFAVSGSLKLFIQSVILNIFAKLLKGKGNYEGTFRVIAYTSSVNVFIWIPVVNFLSLLYGLFVLIMGIKKVNNFSISKAILSIFLFVDIVILGVILFLLFS